MLRPNCMLATFGILLVVPTRASALDAGDIGFIAYQSDDPDRFAFVALAAIPEGTTILFTDDGWDDLGGFRAGEGEVSWSTDVELGTGTVVTVTLDDAVVRASVGTAAMSSTAGTGFDLSIEGDQILAYAGGRARPTLLAAIQMNGRWDNADEPSPDGSTRPPGLVDGESALVLIPEVDNAFYDCTVNRGTPAELRAALFDASRWAGSNEPAGADAFPPECGFPRCGDGVMDVGEDCDGGGDAAASDAAVADAAVTDAGGGGSRDGSHHEGDDTVDVTELCGCRTSMPPRSATAPVLVALLALLATRRGPRR